jgi:Ca2+-binding RTX toxin-like protein
MAGRRIIEGFTHIVGPRNYTEFSNPQSVSVFDGTSENDSISASNSYGSSIFVSGGAGDDELIALGTSRVNLIGEGGSDILFGGTANNSLDGGEGNDFLIGEGGRDILVGGAGDDWIWYDASDNWSGQVNGRYYLRADDGTDTLVLARPQGADLADIDSYVASQAFTLGFTLALSTQLRAPGGGRKNAWHGARRGKGPDLRFERRPARDQHPPCRWQDREDHCPCREQGA